MAKIHLAIFHQILTRYRESLDVDWQVWQDFREEFDRFQGDVRAFSRYVKREFNEPKFQGNLKETQEDQKDLCAEAQALESLLRDRLQVSASFASLKESRLSIEEGQRVKLSKDIGCCLTQQQALTDHFFNSHHASFHLRSHESCFFHIWNEHPRNQQHRQKHLGICRDSNIDDRLSHYRLAFVIFRSH